MDQQPKVSVIMPSLNVAPYIRECIESVVNQTLKDIEIICVDAGSTDGTLEVLEEYAAKDERVKLLHSDKKSYGYQMNMGIDAATGEYMGIVETDDWADANMFEQLYLSAKENDADFVKSNYYKFTSGVSGNITAFENLAACRYGVVFSPCVDKTIFTTTPAIWSGIYSLKMLYNNKIRFNETPGASYQDTSFHFMVCTVANRAYILKNCFLHYRIDNENSSVNTSGKTYYISDEMHYYEKFLSALPDKSALLSEFYQALKYEKYRWNYFRIAPEAQWDFLKLMHEEFSEANKSGKIRKKYFSPEDWENIICVINNPILFFKRTCKVYATRQNIGQTYPCEVIKTATTETPKVTVIIPSYNDEKYILQTIGSVQKQTLDGIEIICVDDGSEDKTFEILYKYAESNDNITLIRQINKGQSVARNEGLKRARGKYIHFLDGDDMVAPDSYKKLYEFASEHDLEILYFDGKSIFESEKLRDEYPYYISAYEYNAELPNCMTGKELFSKMRKANKYRASSCFSLYSREYLNKIHARFTEGVLHEDNAFSFKAIMSAERVSHVNYKCYIRRVRNASIMTKEKGFDNIYGYLATLIEIHNFLEDINLDRETSNQVEAEITNLEGQLRNNYLNSQKKGSYRSRFSEIELCLLDSIIEVYESKIKGISRRPNAKSINNEADLIRQSWSFKIGRFITWLPRKIRGGIKCYKEHGWRYTANRVKWHIKHFFTFKSKASSNVPRPLFVSSDAYKGSGAFLSLLALNRTLNTKYKTKTKTVFPYYGSGQKLINDSNIDYAVIPSSDWIVPINYTPSKKERIKKYDEHTNNIMAAIKISTIVKRGHYNIIHSNTSYTYVGALASRICGVPHVWHIRELLEEDQNKQIMDKSAGYGLMSKSALVIAISKTVHDKYCRIVPANKVKVIYNGIDKNKFYRPAKTIFSGSKPIFLFVSGSDSPLKGRKELIDACAILKRQSIDFELWFVGWCGDRLRDYIKNAGLSNETTFWDYQEKPEEFYEKADICFMCSRNEAFGRTTVEAMMAGNLVIGADVAATKELIKDGQTGLLYIHGNPYSLAEKINYALSNQELMRIIADSGREEMSANFTAEKNAENILNAYKNLLKENKDSGSILYGIQLCKYIFIWMYRKTFGYLGIRLSGSTVYCQKPSLIEPEKKPPCVSIIVPAYNVENYIEQCLDSIVSQTLTNIEIICVNDGSTDRTWSILKRYADGDDRIVLINKENSGYGNSVNIGISAAKGEYIGIVESDDFIDIDMYSNLFAIAKKNNVDIVKSSYWRYFDDNATHTAEVLIAPISSACHPPKKVFSVWEYPEIIYHHPSIWSCIYRKSFLVENNIKFVEEPGGGWVDNPFLIESFCKAKSISWTENAYYYYRQTNPNASSFIKDCSMPFRRTQEMFKFAAENDIVDKRILGSIYKRVLYNAAATISNPYYVSKKDDAIIISELQKVDPNFLTEARVKDDERKAYNYFMEKSEKVLTC